LLLKDPQAWDILKTQKEVGRSMSPSENPVFTAARETSSRTRRTRRRGHRGRRAGKKRSLLQEVLKVIFAREVDQ